MNVKSYSIVKNCQRCGKQVELKADDPQNFQTRAGFKKKLYCGSECQSAAVSASLEKTWIDVKTLVCPKCGAEKNADQFPLKGKTKKGVIRRYPYCKPCHTDHQRSVKLEKKFNLTPEDYKTIDLFQSRVCAVCGRPPKTKRLSVDHNHASGLIRGLLCSFCNRVIGLFRDDIARFEKVLEYLKNPPAVIALGGPRYGIKGRTTNKAETIKKLNKNLILSNQKAQS